MKNVIKSYLSFSRTERMGLTALLSLLMLLIAVRAGMHFFVHQQINNTAQQKLAQAWETFKHSDTSTTYYEDISGNSLHSEKPALIHHEHNGLAASRLFLFDPNTLDSSGFRRIGLSQKTTAILLHWRAKGKVFHKKEDLKNLYTLKPEEYAMLAPYITIANATVPKDKTWYKDDNETYMPPAEQIDINTADSMTLVHIKGIGPVTAHKIIEWRNKTPFTSIDQLMEIRHFPESVFAVLRKHLVTGRQH